MPFLGWTPLLLALGAMLRLLGVGWGLPQLFNADEPHFVNLAVSFGSGDLNPHLFKYPTLWMYALSGTYGAYYLAWSRLGAVRGAEQFGALFAWQPERFYLLGRLLSIGFSCLALAAAARTARFFSSITREPGEIESADFPWALGLLAVSPTLVESARAARPDSLLLLLSCLAWHHGLRVYHAGRPRDYLLTGLFSGLAFSTQYTALPALLILPLAHLLRRSPGPAAPLALGLCASCAGFLAGTPYAALDFRAFRESLLDQRALRDLDPVGLGTTLGWIVSHPFRIAGPWSLAAPSLALGAWKIGRSDRRLLALLLLPFAAYGCLAAAYPYASNLRYYCACFLPFALLAGAGLSFLARRARSAPATLLLAVWAFGPGAWAAARQGIALTRPDTRLLASAWIASNVPEGSGILLDQAHASPAVRMSRSQAQELFQELKARGSRRARYYELLASAHPGGGYRIWRIRRSARDLATLPGHMRLSQSEGPYLDAGAGLRALRARGIRYVVTTSFGAAPERAAELRLFFEQLGREGKLVAEFLPSPGRVEGPLLRVYKI